MYTTELLKQAITTLKPSQLILWLVAADKDYEKVSQLTIEDAREYGVVESTFYRNKNTVKLPCRNINYSDEELDAIEAAAAEQYKNSISTASELSEPSEPTKPKTWQETFKSIDLRSDRLKKASKGYTIPEEEEEEKPISVPTKPRKFTPIDIAAIGTDDYSPYNDEEELAKLEAEQNRKKQLLKMGMVN